MLRIITFTPVWRRPEVFEICLAGLQRLKAYAPRYFDITPFFIVSEDEAAEQVERFGFDYIFHENQPLGAKKNAGLAHVMRNFEFDYLLEVGSDDLLSNHYLDLMAPWMQEGIPHLIPDSCWLLDARTGQTAFWQTQIIVGLGRLMKREALALFAAENYELWTPGKNRGMDMCSALNLKARGVEHQLVHVPGILSLDIKTDENINSIFPFENTPLDAAGLASYFPEKEMILNLLGLHRRELASFEKEELETIYFLKRMKK